MDVSIDTRTIKKGQTFIPIKGPNFDGHTFIPQAIAKGAKILDVDIQDYAKLYRKKLRATVIGITGSAGKTTVKEMLHAILSTKYKVHKTHENENNEYGVPLTLLRADGDTDIILLEMAMRGRGEIAFLTKIARPSHVVITNIGTSHIARLGTQHQIALAKGEIFRPPLKWEKQPRTAFLNFSSAEVDVLVKKAKQANFQILPFEGDERPIQNLNLCYSLGRHFGLSVDQIETGLQSYQSASHRLKHIRVGEITIVDDTYNASPEGVEYALQSIKRQNNRKLLVLGDMKELGSVAKRAHRQLVAIAIDCGIQHIFTFGEESKQMRSTTIPILHFDSKKDLHKALLREIKANDWVLIKGSRAMKMEETVTFLETHGR